MNQLPGSSQLTSWRIGGQRFSSCYLLFITNIIITTTSPLGGLESQGCLVLLLPLYHHLHHHLHQHHHEQAFQLTSWRIGEPRSSPLQCIIIIISLTIIILQLLFNWVCQVDANQVIEATRFALDPYKVAN